MSEIEDRINEKLQELKIYLEELESIEIPDFEEYQKNNQVKAASERYFEKIIEAIISVAVLMIKEKNLKSPEAEEQAFLILAKNRIIGNELAIRLREAKDMRNIIIHNYQKVDDEIVYEAITREIIGDAEEFLRQVEGQLNRKE